MLATPQRPRGSKVQRKPAAAEFSEEGGSRNHTLTSVVFLLNPREPFSGQTHAQCGRGLAESKERADGASSGREAVTGGRPCGDWFVPTGLHPGECRWCDRGRHGAGS